MEREVPWWMVTGTGPSARVSRLFWEPLAGDPVGVGEPERARDAAAERMRLDPCERRLPPAGRPSLSAEQRREYLRRMRIVR